MDSDHFQQNPHNQDLPWDFDGSENIETIAQSQAATIFTSFDGLPRMGQDQYLMASLSSSPSMLNNDYTRAASQMPGSQNPSSWAHQAPLTPGFGDDGNGYSYDGRADYSCLEQQSLKAFDNIPRTTWQQPYANMTMTLPV
ncbi:hypothetical protein EYC80_004181 [Monilinia laxa]|nr:hypothetical protein EYC80_004181 [Monilinia laxa]